MSIDRMFRNLLLLTLISARSRLAQASAEPGFVRVDLSKRAGTAPGRARGSCGRGG